jgi:LPXTG-site transpeptidase (sortase) family protein
MWRVVAGVATVFVLGLVSAPWGRWRADAVAQTATAGAPAMSEQLRHVGRDPGTGTPVRVDDHFIASREEARERYGKDERQPVPPPPAGEVDVTAVAIPAIAIEARTERFGLDAFGRLDVPQDHRTVGWYPAYSALPGEGEATFLAAHYEFAGRQGVFHKLSRLAPGSDVVVTLSDGSNVRYRVTSTVDYDLGIIDMGALLLGREGTESLTLMTCSGSFSDGTYDLRTVVLAERAEG